MSELEEIKARAAARREQTVTINGHLQHVGDEDCTQSEADLDRAIAISEETEQRVVSAFARTDELEDEKLVVERERDEARAAVLALRDGINELVPDGIADEMSWSEIDRRNDAEQLLADTESYEQYRKAT